MFIKVETWIILEVEDRDAGEQAAMAINQSLAGNMRSFPVGEVIEVEVDHFEEVSDDEALDKGYLEE